MVESIEPLTETAPQEKKADKNAEPIKKECMGLKLDDGVDVETIISDLEEILSAYPGDIDVYVKAGDKKFKCGMSVRNCKGLVSELSSIVDPKNIIFFAK